VTVDDAERCSWSYRVRFDEGGPDGLIRTSVLLRYTQDLAGHHSTVRGFGRDWYAERGITFLVRAAEVSVLGPIPVGSDLVGTTHVVGWRRVWARRRTEFVGDAGDLLAQVHIDWVLLDRRGVPVRIPPEFRTFGAPEVTFALARVDLGQAPATASRRELHVRPQELDPMDHVNNAVYADWLDEAVIDAGGTEDVRAVPRRLRLDYARAAEPGTRATTLAWRDPSAGWACRIVDAEGNDLLRASLGSR
jgi:acyl-CoA thioesterase FadM